jgi:hypothetical protein
MQSGDSINGVTMNRYEAQLIAGLWRVVDLENPKVSAPVFATEEIAQTIASALNAEQAKAKGA